MRRTDGRRRKRKVKRGRKSNKEEGRSEQHGQRLANDVCRVGWGSLTAHSEPWDGDPKEGLGLGNCSASNAAH